ARGCRRLDVGLETLPERLPDRELVRLRLIDVGSPLNLPIVGQPLGIALHQEARQVVNVISLDRASPGISRPCHRTDPQQTGGQDRLEILLDLGRVAHRNHRIGRSRMESPRATTGKSLTRTSTDWPSSAAARTA